ncbi:hypothetical protein ACIO6T_30595 [Streptomyces sp. NPDC087532]|uniref:hypothetical protein n=1 Tax=Streptomyces sp. NPDC087532 TaxID=3365795 RepID=UPI00382E5531
MPDQQPKPSHPNSRPGVEEILRVHAAPRQRSVDEHMFTADEICGEPCTFRLQLFTALGHRSVAVATQTSGEGRSLTNGAERYASRVWEVHDADAAEPPIWIQHQVRAGGYEMVSFGVDGRFKLSQPGWRPITEGQLAALVGAEVDGSRGEGYVPRPAPPEEQLRYEIMAVADLPEPDPFREACMEPPRRALARPRKPTHCCWYHAQDWSTVSELAIRVVEQARREGKTDSDIADQFSTRPRELGTDDSNFSALHSLLDPSIGIMLHLGEDASYTNGNHRARAMKDAEVDRTVVVTWLPPEPD